MDNPLTTTESNLSREQNEAAGFETWLKIVQQWGVVPPVSIDAISNSVNSAKEKSVPLPLILTLCPAIKNLPRTNDKGQTRELVPLSEHDERLKKFVEELISFMLFTKRVAGVNPEVFLIFADRLEPQAERMFVNCNQMPEIATTSVKSIRQAFFGLDQTKPGLLQREQIRIPKVWKQTELQLAGTNTDTEIRKKMLDIFTLKEPIFGLWLENLRRTRVDPTFVETGWQTIESAKTIWDRVLFMLAQCVVDGEILPKLMQRKLSAKFQAGMPNPIFLASTTRKDGILLEMDGFTLSPTGAMAPFHNVGRWLDPPNETPWKMDSCGAILGGQWSQMNS